MYLILDIHSFPPNHLSAQTEIGPKVVVTDFKIALINTIKFQFPKSKLLDAFFIFNKLKF
ncbi:hypothetical protein MXB_2419 [Myxobolus squamalis]|nr:hypothetical protein MXB_2419 [Myxobolus squamalis]